MEFNSLPSSEMARLDQNNAFCAARTCTMNFNGGLNVNDLHVKRHLVMDKSGDEVFDVNVASLDSSRVSLSRSEGIAIHPNYTFEK